MYNETTPAFPHTKPKRLYMPECKRLLAQTMCAWSRSMPSGNPLGELPSLLSESSGILWHVTYIQTTRSGD